MIISETDGERSQRTICALPNDAFYVPESLLNAAQACLASVPHDSPQVCEPALRDFFAITGCPTCFDGVVRNYNRQQTYCEGLSIDVCEGAPAPCGPGEVNIRLENAAATPASTSPVANTTSASLMQSRAQRLALSCLQSSLLN